MISCKAYDKDKPYTNCTLDKSCTMQHNVDQIMHYLMVKLIEIDGNKTFLSTMSV